MTEIFRGFWLTAEAMANAELKNYRAYMKKALAAFKKKEKAFRAEIKSREES